MNINIDSAIVRTLESVRLFRAIETNSNDPKFAKMFEIADELSKLFEAGSARDTSSARSLVSTITIMSDAETIAAYNGFEYLLNCAQILEARLSGDPAPTLEECATDFVRDFKSFVANGGWENDDSIRWDIRDVNNLGKWFVEDRRGTSWLSSCIRRVVDRMHILAETTHFGDLRTFDRVIFAADRMSDAMEYDSPLQWPIPESKPTPVVLGQMTYFEKMLRDAYELLCGDAAEAINTVIEWSDLDDSKIKAWEAVESKRRDIATRLREFIETEIKPQVVIEVNGGVADVSSAPVWIDVEIKDFDGDIECPECGEGMHDDFGPCPSCGWEEAEEEDHE